MAPKKLGDRFASLSFSGNSFTRKKSQKSRDTGESKAAAVGLDVPITSTSSEAASSIKGHLTTTGIPKSDIGEEPTSPLAGADGTRFNGDGEPETAILASLSDRITSEELFYNSKGTASEFLADADPEAPVLPLPTGTISAPESFNPENEAAQLWDAAYDYLRDRHPLIEIYESIVELYLARKDPKDQWNSIMHPLGRKDEFSHPSDPCRRERMDHVIDIWQSKWDDDRIIINNEDTPSKGIARSLRAVLRPLIDRSRYASLPWATACLALEVRPPSHSDAFAYKYLREPLTDQIQNRVFYSKLRCPRLSA